ncbi:MAG: S1 RNA-binding domain-containing protein [Bacillota bacterium]
MVTGEVTRTAPFGAFVQLEPGVEGLVHISEIADYHIAKPEDALSSGDVVRVKVLRVRPEERRISLSVRQADQIVIEDNPQDENLPETNEQAEDVTSEAPVVPPVEEVPEVADKLEAPEEPGTPAPGAEVAQAPESPEAAHDPGAMEELEKPEAPPEVEPGTPPTEGVEEKEAEGEAQVQDKEPPEGRSGGRDRLTRF